MLEKENCLFLIIDVQEKLLKMLGDSEVLKNTEVLAKTCDILDIDTIITEQYPKGLGKTAEEIVQSAKSAKYFEKTSFSALQDENIFSAIKNCGKKQVVICGIEAHICVLQTALELVEKGYEVYFVKDCSGSRKNEDFAVAIELMKQEGVKILTKEIAVFSLLKTSKHPNFKEIQALIK